MATEHDWLAEQFEHNRDHLRAVAFRMLASSTEADDAVQETWLRLSRSDTAGVQNLGGWLTTVVGRVCLDMLHPGAAGVALIVDSNDLRLVRRARVDPAPDRQPCSGLSLASHYRSHNVEV
jgi:RNA polymerase sigma-70 factor, ECF subfamily